MDIFENHQLHGLVPLERTGAALGDVAAGPSSSRAPADDVRFGGRGSSSSSARTGRASQKRPRGAGLSGARGPAAKRKKPQKSEGLVLGETGDILDGADFASPREGDDARNLAGAWSGDGGDAAGDVAVGLLSQGFFFCCSRQTSARPPPPEHPTLPTYSPHIPTQKIHHDFQKLRARNQRKTFVRSPPPEHPTPPTVTPNTESKLKKHIRATRGRSTVARSRSRVEHTSFKFLAVPVDWS